MKKGCVFLLGFLILFTATMAWAGSARDSGAQTGQRVLRVEVFERNTSGLNPAENWATRWIQENFGNPRNVKVEFTPVPRGQEIDMINILLAANNAPDICFVYNGGAISTYVQQGGVMQMDQYLNTPAGRVISAYLGENVLSWGRWNGNQYALPSRRMELGATATFIRKDWLDKLGLPVPTTRDQFYNTLVAFKNQDPGGVGRNLIPLAMEAYDPGVTWAAATIMDTFITPAALAPRELAIRRNIEFTTEGYKEGVRYLNRLYNEGLVSPNFALDKDKQQFQRDIQSGNVGAFINSPVAWVYGRGIQNTLKENSPGAEFIPIDPFVNAAGQRAKRSNDPIGYYVFTPRTSKVPDLVVEYLAWMTDQSVLRILRNGYEGIHFTSRTEDGIVLGAIPQNDLPNEQKWPAGDLILVINGTDWGSEEMNNKAIMLSNPEYGQFIIQTNSIANNGRFDVPPITANITSESNLGTTVRNKGNELYVRSIMASPAQFDQVYDQLYREYMDVGARRILEEKTAAWDRERR